MSAPHRRKKRDTRIVGPPKIVVVGHCAAGKSTLVNGLRDAGIDAFVSAQEHSIVPELWKRRRPDLLVFLDVDLDTIRHRRGRSWPASVYALQERRLAPARGSADLEIRTSDVNSIETLSRTLDLVEQWRVTAEDERAI